MITISKAMEILSEYLKEYGNMPLGFVDSESHLTPIENIYVVGISNDEQPGYEEHIVVLTGDYEENLTTE